MTNPSMDSIVVVLGTPNVHTARSIDLPFRTASIAYCHWSTAFVVVSLGYEELVDPILI